MSAATLKKCVLTGLCAVFGVAGTSAQAGAPHDKFYKGYYLEQVEGDWAAAATL